MKVDERSKELRKQINEMKEKMKRELKEAEPLRRSSLNALDDAEKDAAANASKLSRREMRKNKKKKSISGANKRRKKSTEKEFDRFVKICDYLAESKSDEQIAAYEKNPMIFWKEHKKLLPNAFKVAKRTFVIPASSTSAERIFKLNKRNRAGARGNKGFLKNEQEIILGSYLRMLR